MDKKSISSITHNDAKQQEFMMHFINYHCYSKHQKNPLQTKYLLVNMNTGFKLQC
jgi:hypothetical protein